MIAAVGTIAGVFLVDVESEELLGEGTEVPDAGAPVVERRPPLAISRDGGATWTEAGGGLPAGFAVAVAEDDPDRMLFAARNRLFVSRNGGVFWHALPFELPDVEGVAWLD